MWFRRSLFLLLLIACTESPTAPSDGISSLTLSVWQSDLEVDAQMQLTVEVRDHDDSLVVDPVLTWSTDLPTIATVNAAGQLRGVSVGTVRVTVRSGGLSATRTVIIRPVRLYTLTVAGPSGSVHVGGRLQLSALLRSDDGLEIHDPPVIWSADPAQVAEINSVGGLLGVAPGNVTITASSDAFRATRVVTVLPAIPATVVLSGSARMLRPGEYSQFSATVVSADSLVIHDAELTWSSSDPAVFSVSANGLVTAVGAGKGTLTMVAGPVSASRTVTVLGTPPLLHQLTFLRTTGNESHIEVTTETGALLASIQPSIALSAHGRGTDPTVSMAPDGNTIAYDCTAGACQLQLADGGAAIAYPLSDVLLPSWNSDGSVLLMRQGPSSLLQYGWAQHTQLARPVPQRVNLSRMSPDGLWILYECNSNIDLDGWPASLCLMDGEGAVVLYKNFANAPSWSSWDGSLAYLRFDGFVDDDAVLVIEPVQERPVPSGAGKTEYPQVSQFGSFNGVTETAWSPDGRGLAVVRNGELWLFSMPGVTNPVQIAHIEGSRISSISWR